MKKGLLAAALAAILTLSTLTACGGTGTDGSGQEDLPRLVIASDNYEPYSYVGPNGNLIGVDVDLATEACRRLGYRSSARSCGKTRTSICPSARWTACGAALP